MKRLLPPLLILVAVVACSVGKAKPLPVQTATVSRRDITITADANGVIEPIVIVEIKSKASGMLMKLNVETGTFVKNGDVLAQIDTRDVQSRLDQAKADYSAAEASLQVATAQKKRSDTLLKAKVITATENEGARLTFENAQSQWTNKRAAVDLAQLSFDDATVKALTFGTIIEKDVAEGQIIQSSTTSSGAGTTLLKMADLTKVRMRSYFNETDIGMITPSEDATVTVDAYPDRRFVGKVEKIEPQAVVQQGVTMFPVLINLDNSDGALRPGMNGEVSALVDQRVNVLAVTNDAIKTQREGPAISPLLGISADSFNTMMRLQTARGGGRGQGANAGAGIQQGEVDLAPTAGAKPDSTKAGRGGNVRGGGQAGGGQAGANQQGGGQAGGGQRGGGRGPQVQVTDEECTTITAAIAKHPKEKALIDSARAKMRDPNADRPALNAQIQDIYTKIGVDGPKAGACVRKQMQAAGGAGGSGGGGRGGRGGRGRGAGGQRGLNVDTGEQVEKPQSQRQTNHPGLVFVADSVHGSGPATYTPRNVMLGPGNLDVTEVVSGLNEGDRVVLLNVLALQAQRQQQIDRQKQNANPLGGGNPGAGRGPGGGGGPPGGGGRGGF